MKLNLNQVQNEADEQEDITNLNKRNQKFHDKFNENENKMKPIIPIIKT